MNLITLKVISLVALFVISFICVMIPIKLFRRMISQQDQQKKLAYQRKLGYLSCFGGGVFLATCFLHLFPEAETLFNSGLEEFRIHNKFPLCKFVVVFGFICILTAEQIVLSFKEKSEKEEERQRLLDTSRNIRRYGSNEPLSQSGEESRILYSVHEDPSSHSNLRSMILVLALSLHSVFEGTAIGFEKTEENVVSVLSAVLIHKSILAFTLGLNLIQSKFSSKLIILCNIIFSSMAPIGLAIGIGITNFLYGPILLLISGGLQCIATGSFIFVIFFEILPHEFHYHSDRIVKLFWLIIGFGSFSYIIYYKPS